MDPDSGFRLWIPTPKINQSCRDGSGTWSRLVCLPFWLACLLCSLSVRGCCTTSMNDHVKNIPDSPSGLCSHHVLSESVPLCWEFLTDPAFSTTFTTNSTVIESAVGLTPVEHPRKKHELLSVHLLMTHWPSH